MILLENTVRTLKVVRQSDMGVFLDAGTGNTSDDILLHKEQQLSPVGIGEEVTVFLYKDPKHRLTASMRLPQLKLGQIGYTDVVNATSQGIWVNVGTERGIFVPLAERRGRPKVGEKVWIRLYEDKSGRLAASMNVDDAMRRASVPVKDLFVGSEVEGSIYNITDEGAFLITPDRFLIFIHRSEMPEIPNVGSKVRARITYLREDGRANASLRPVKQEAMIEDKARILSYLESRSGKMPYTDKTDPEHIKNRFFMSKAAFKRALGGLMKEGKIEQKDGWTLLITKNK